MRERDLKESKKQSEKQRQIVPVIQSGLILILVVFVISMMVQIQRLQGTARVINYAGLVRGATQREVKLEITKEESDELIRYLDDILDGLKYGNGNYHLTRLPNKDYQSKLDMQIKYWQELKNEIYKVREKGYEATDVVEMSERYFSYADDTVSAAETYSEMIADKIRMLEYLSAFDMVLLIGLIIEQYFLSKKIAKANKLLKKKAYLDVHTELPNKSRCEELLQNSEFLSKSTVCLMFDLNNLKIVNDSLGHAAGDSLISNFARILRNVVLAKDFVGRFGGDEFMVVLYESGREEAEVFLGDLKAQIENFNKYSKSSPISYAHGYAVSGDYRECTLRTLMDKADHSMYMNKQKEKGTNR